MESTARAISGTRRFESRTSLNTVRVGPGEVASAEMEVRLGARKMIGTTLIALRMRGLVISGRS
jgi:predicted secreted protein